MVHSSALAVPSRVASSLLRGTNIRAERAVAGMHMCMLDPLGKEAEKKNVRSLQRLLWRVSKINLHGDLRPCRISQVRVGNGSLAG